MRKKILLMTLVPWVVDRAGLEVSSEARVQGCGLFSGTGSGLRVQR